jgi:flagellar M-ring protein FliF
VPKLTADQVTVADSSGRVLNSGGEGGASAQDDARAQQAQAIEDDTSNSVQSMLDKLVGPGHAVVRVDAALNFDQTKVDREEYISNKLNPPLTDSTTKETYKGAGTNPVGGVLGPDNNAVPSGTATSGNNSYVKQSDNRTNAVGTLKTSTTRAPGQISRMTVAVVLDQLVAGGVNDAEVTKLVTSAAGLDPKRGDVVTVSKMAFDTQAAAAAKKELDAAAADKQRADMFNMAKTGGLIVLIALALFIGVRRSRKEQRTPVDLGELPVYRDERAELPSAPMAMAVTSASSAPVLPAAPANALAESNLQARNEIGQLIEQQPDEVARLLRGWLVDRRP